MLIENITIGEDLITLHCGKDTIKLHAIGDCCSRSHFHEPHAISKLIGSKFVSLSNYDVFTDDENKLLKNLQSEPGVECMQLVKYILDTSTNRFTLLLVNESNGYYSGWIDMTINGKYASRDIL